MLNVNKYILHINSLKHNFLWERQAANNPQDIIKKWKSMYSIVFSVINIDKYYRIAKLEGSSTSISRFVKWSYAFVLRTNQENEMSALEPSPKKMCFRLY